MRHLIGVIALAVLAAGCGKDAASGDAAGVDAAGAAAPQAQAELSGTVAYRERIALPKGAVVKVELRDVSRADAPAGVLAIQTIRTQQQVPIPFALPYDPAKIDQSHRYAVRAEIRTAGDALMWTTMDAYPVLTNGAPADGVDIVVKRVVSKDAAAAGEGYTPNESGITAVFACPTLGRLTVTFGPGEMQLARAGETRVFSQAPSADGARFTEGDDEFWNKGDDAMVTLDGVKETCTVENKSGAQEGGE